MHKQFGFQLDLHRSTFSQLISLQKMEKILRFIYFSLFFLLFLVFISERPTKLPGHHRRLHLRSTASQPEWKETLDEDDEGFNVTERVVSLFPKIDVDPRDGFVSVEELADWKLQLVLSEALGWTESDFLSYDENHDGLVSFSEFESPTWATAAGHGASALSYGYDFGWWDKKHFYASDEDGNGFLDMDEFHDFLHPADTKSPKLLLWLCGDVVRDRDNDKDGKLSFSEFFPGIFDSIRRDEDYDDSLNWNEDATIALAKKMLSELDKDHDGYISAAELMPVIGKIYPSEAYYAKKQAQRIVSQVDSDKDGRLSLKDMVDNPDVFYNTLHGEDEMDYYSYID